MSDVLNKLGSVIDSVFTKLGSVSELELSSEELESEPLSEDDNVPELGIVTVFSLLGGDVGGSLIF